MNITGSEKTDTAIQTPHVTYIKQEKKSQLH